MFDRIKQRYGKFHAVINLDQIDQRDFDELKQESRVWNHKMMGTSAFCIASYVYFIHGPLFKNVNLGNLRELKIQLIFTGFAISTMGICSILFMGKVYDVTDRLFDKYIGDLTALDRIEENYPSIVKPH